MLQDEIGSAFRIARKALKKLAPARTKQELDEAMQGMGDRTASSNTDGAAGGSSSDGGVFVLEAEAAEAAELQQLRQHFDNPHKMDRAKNKVFRSMCTEVIGLLHTSNPDTAEAHDLMGWWRHTGC